MYGPLVPQNTKKGYAHMHEYTVHDYMRMFHQPQLQDYSYKAAAVHTPSVTEPGIELRRIEQISSKKI